MSTQKQQHTEELTRRQTYRTRAGIMSAADVDRPAWAQDIAVNDELRYVAEGEHYHGRVAGFSVDERYYGLPVVYTPAEIRAEVGSHLLALDVHNLPGVEDGE